MAYAIAEHTIRGTQSTHILTARRSRSPPRNTVAVDPKYQELVTIHDRDFQKYSIENIVHLVPVDEASEISMAKGACTEDKIERDRTSGSSAPRVQPHVRWQTDFSPTDQGRECLGLWVWFGFVGYRGS